MSHTPFDQVDPFTQVLLQLWAILEGSPAFTNFVKPGNRIKFTGAANQNPIKKDVQPGDLPECIIEPITSADEPAKTSMSAMVSQTWSIKIATNDLRINAGMFQVRWAVLQAFAKAGDNLGLYFISRTRITTSLSNIYDPVENRGTYGWTLMLTIVTDLEFAKVNGQLAN